MSIPHVKLLMLLVVLLLMLLVVVVHAHVHAAAFIALLGMHHVMGHVDHAGARRRQRAGRGGGTVGCHNIAAGRGRAERRGRAARH
jgi:hypothetical protein